MCKIVERSTKSQKLRLYIYNITKFLVVEPNNFDSIL